MDDNEMDMPCFRELLPYFSPEVVECFEYWNKPIPYMLKILEEVCLHTECKHNIFSDSIDLGRKKNGTHQERMFHETEYSKTCCNCMCLIERPATWEEIAEMYDLDISTTASMERSLLEKLRAKILNDSSQQKGVVSGQREKRKYDKKVRGESVMTQRAGRLGLTI